MSEVNDTVKITVAQIDSLRVKLAALPKAPSPPSHSATKMEAVAALAPELTALRARGWGLQALAALLAEGGVRISSGTLKNYLQRAGATRKRRRKRNSTTPSTSAAPNGALPAALPTTPPVAARTVGAVPPRIGGFVVREDTEI